MVRPVQRFLVCALLAGLVAVVPATAGAQTESPVRVADLIAESLSFADTIITVEGELIGDYGTRRSGWMWTQLNDDPYVAAPLVDGGARAGSNVGIGVTMPRALAEDLDPAGGYRLRGPVVRLTGVWKHHDPDRGGESYLEVAALEVVEPGRRLEEGPDWIVAFLAIGLLAAAGLLWFRRPAEE